MLASPNSLADIDIAYGYGLYCAERERLHHIELQQIDPIAEAQALTRTLHAKEGVARAAISMYEGSQELPAFTERIESALLADGRVVEDGHRMGTDDSMLGAYLLPLSQVHPDLPSPIEAIYATIANRGIVQDFVEPIKEEADGMLMSGTNAWGAFCSVKGGVPPKLREAGVSQLPYGKFSDIDLLINANSVEGLGSCLERYIGAGLVRAQERGRFSAFVKLYDQGEADIFSLRAHHGDVEESIHFVPTDVIGRISAMTPVRSHTSDSNLRYSIVRDFRPNVPRNIKRYRSYPLRDIRDIRQEAFVPHIQKVESSGGNTVGYLSENTVGGPAVIGGEKTYYLGVLSFFVAVAPVILIDRDNRLSAKIKKLQTNIGQILAGEAPSYVPRQESMPRHTLANIADMLKC